MSKPAKTSLVAFYSWQSDLPNYANRGLIKEALEKATLNLGSEDVSVSVTESAEGYSGAPDIPQAITEKIFAADAFIADVTIVQRGKKSSPNTNVTFELGQASARLGWSRCLLVMNTFHGPIEELPFDYRGRRIICYCAAPDPTRVDELNNSCDELATSLQKALREIASALDPVRPHPSLDKDEGVYLQRLARDHAAVDTLYVALSGHTSVPSERASRWPSHVLPVEFGHLRSHATNVADEKETLTTLSDALHLHRQFVLAGPPGAGKSCTLRQFCYKTACEALRDPSAPVPLFVRLSEWSEEDVRFEDFLARMSRRDYGRPVRFLRRYLLDGLDEIRLSVRERAVASLEQWLVRNEDVSVVIGSRIRSYRDESRPKLPIVEIHPLTPEEVRLFAVSYFRADAGKFLDILGWRQDSVPPLAANPYELALQATLYEETGSVSTHRADLLRKHVLVTYERERGRGQTFDLSYATVLDIFGVCALGMLVERGGAFPARERLETLTAPGFPVDQLILLGLNCNFLRLGARFVEFRHQLFVEYFAALQLTKDTRSLTRLLKRVASPGSHYHRKFDDLFTILLDLHPTGEAARQVVMDAPHITARILRDLSPGSLGEIPVRQLVEQLIGQLGQAEDRAGPARSALSAVGVLAVPSLVKALDEANAFVRRSAHAVLRTMNDRGALLVAVQRGLGDPERWIRRETRQYFRKLGEQDSDTLRAFVRNEFAALEPVAQRVIASEVLEWDELPEDIRSALEALPGMEPRDDGGDGEPEKSVSLDAIEHILTVQSGESRKHTPTARDPHMPTAAYDPALEEELFRSLASVGSGKADPVIARLVAMGPGVVAAAIKALRSPSEPLRRRAPRILRNFPLEHVHAALCAAVADPAARVRAHVVSALGATANPRGLRHVVTALDDEAPIVRAEAVRAVGNIAGSAAVGILLDRASEMHPTVQMHIAQVLAEHGTADRRTIAYLEDIGADRHPDAFRESFYALLQLQPVETWTKADRALFDTDYLLRGAAVVALRRFVRTQLRRAREAPSEALVAAPESFISALTCCAKEEPVATLRAELQALLGAWVALGNVSVARALARPYRGDWLPFAAAGLSLLGTACPRPLVDSRLAAIMDTMANGSPPSEGTSVTSAPEEP